MIELFLFDEKFVSIRVDGSLMIAFHILRSSVLIL